MPAVVLPLVVLLLLRRGICAGGVSNSTGNATTTTSTTTGTTTRTATTSTTTTSTATTSTTTTSTATTTATTTTTTSTYDLSIVAPPCTESLLDAVLAGQVEEVKRYAVLGLDLNCRRDREYLLQLVLRNSQEEMALLIASSLVPGNPHLTARNATGAAPLLMAADQGFTSVVVALLDQGVDVTNASASARDLAGHNVLHLAAPFEQTSEAYLRHRRVTPQAAAQVLFGHDDLGNLPIHYAILRASSPEAALRNADAILNGLRHQAEREAELLAADQRQLSLKALVNAPGAGGNRPVHLTAQLGLLRELQRLGARMDAEVLNDDRQLVLHTTSMWPGAGSSGALDFVAGVVLNVSASGGARRLVATETSLINARDAFGRTPLHYAAGIGDSATVRWLVSRGADMRLQDASGDRPLEYGLRFGHKELVRTFSEYGGSPLQSVVLVGDYDLLVELVLHSGNLSIPVHSTDPATGRTALFEAAETGNLQIIGFFVDQGTDVALVDFRGLTPLAAAVQAGQVEAARYLVSRGADVNQRLGQGLTALHAAAEAACGPCVEVLLELGAAIDATDARGRTALHLCRGAAAAEALLRAGAALLATSDAGFYAPHVAASDGRVDVLRVMLVWRLGGDGAATGLRSLRGDTPLHLAVASGQGEAVTELLRWCASVGATNDGGRTAAAYAASSEVRALLRDAAALPSRCQCDCGPFAAAGAGGGELFTTTGWTAGCSAQVGCLASYGTGMQEQVRCTRGPAAEAAAAAAAAGGGSDATGGEEAATNSSGGELVASGGLWAPARPSFACAVAAGARRLLSPPSAVLLAALLACCRWVGGAALF